MHSGGRLCEASIVEGVIGPRAAHQVTEG
jgi:hypothetical protein